MITNKDIRVDNGSLIINGDPYPLDGQSPEAIMQIVKDNSDTTPTANSDAPVTSAGIKTYVDDLIKTEYITDTIDTFAGNTSVTVSKPLNVPQGYKVIGVSEVLTSTTKVAIIGFYTDKDGVLKLSCANLYSTPISNVTVGVTLIYVRT